MNPAPNLILIGPMGAGKTCIGRRLAERFTLDFVDVDQAIVDAAGASIPTIFEHSGEAGFRSHEREALARVLEGRGQLVSTGGGAVLDPGNRALIAQRGFVVYLRVSVAAHWNAWPATRAGRCCSARTASRCCTIWPHTATRCTASWPTSPSIPTHTPLPTRPPIWWSSWPRNGSART